MEGIQTVKGSWPWPWPWIRPYGIPSCITHRPLPTYQISFKSKKLFVDGRTDGRTFPPSNIIRSTFGSRPKKQSISVSITISIIEEFLPLRKRGNWKMFMFCAQLEIAGAIFLQPACASCHQPTVSKHWDDIQNKWLTGIIQHMGDSLASTYESRLLFFSVSSKLISFNFFVCIITTATVARITYSSPTSTPPHLQEQHTWPVTHFHGKILREVWR